MRKTCPLGPADIAALADSKLLQCMMVSAPVCDAALEHLLTSARRSLLDLAVLLKHTHLMANFVRAFFPDRHFSLEKS